MHRLSIGVALALTALFARGERIQALYREGSDLVFEGTDSLTMALEEASMSLDGRQLPPETLEELGLDLPDFVHETRSRTRDVVLAARDGRPTRVRRSFELLRQHEEELGEETEKTGPLEGRTLVLEEEEGEVVAQLEGEEVEQRYLEGHLLTGGADPLLPTEAVDVGDRWQVEGEELRRFLGLDTGPELFEPDEQDLIEKPLEKLFEEGGGVTGEVELVGIEERDERRCAVLAFTLDFEAEIDDIAALGFELAENLENTTGGLQAAVRGKGKLWFALDEGRPVALEETLEGTLDVHFEAHAPAEEKAFRMEIALSFRLEGEAQRRWTRGE